VGYQAAEAATRADLQAVVRRWVTDAPFVLAVEPADKLVAATTGADRSAVPMPVGEVPVTFPAFQRATLDNGLKLIVVERPELPVVGLSLILDAGYAADQSAQPGTASLTMAMLDEGTKTRNALEISEQLALLGASIGAGSSLDTSSIGLSALADKLEPSLEIFADVLLNPVFPQEELDRLRKEYLAALSQEKTQPNSMALRVMPKLLYGEGHAYAQPLTGTGTEATLAALTREDLARFHTRWFRPNNATLIAVGPVTVASLKPQLERLLRAWQPGVALARGVYDIPYPADTPEVVPDALIVPMNGFDDGGYRLGYGGGFFDRTLAAIRETGHRVVAIGVAYEQARIDDALHPQPYDVPMDFVVTERGVYERREGRLEFLGASNAGDPSQRASPVCYADEVDPKYFG
jgi:zinc protease